MIIFGTRGITTTPEKGHFNCPSCASKQNYGLKRVRRFFTLYFIPLIPLDKLGEYVECTGCKDTYKPNILDYDPEANARAVQAEYHAALKKVMIYVLLADGIIDDTEVDTILAIYQQITQPQIDKVRLLQEINAIQNNPEDFSQVLVKLQGLLNEQGKEMVLKAALYVALADGEFQEEEKIMVINIGKGLGMTESHIRGVASSIL